MRLGTLQMPFDTCNLFSGHCNVITLNGEVILTVLIDGQQPNLTARAEKVSTHFLGKVHIYLTMHINIRSLV